MSNPKISIITPCYNSQDFIEKCVKSVLSQTYKNIEFIIVDGCSTDNTLSIINKYKDRINIISEKDNGNYDAINKGFRNSTGDVLTWLDSDNYYNDDFVIEKIANKFISNTRSDIVITNCYYRYQESDKLHLINPNKNKINFRNIINLGNMFMPECAFYKKELIDKTGGLNLELKMLADYDLWIRIFSLSPVIEKLNIISSVYNIRPNALLRKNFTLSWKESFAIGKKYKRNFYYKIRMYILFIKAQLRQMITSTINKNSNLRSFVIRKFK